VATDLVASLEKKTPHFRNDGVSCESCHGAAEHWLNLHHLPTWKNRSRADKQRQGLNDTQSLSGRAQLCVTCHVGDAGMDVDHDLIAAGHPRLHFEFAAFHAFMPRHWPDAQERDFETRAWLTGQLVTAQASLELFAHRAGDPKRPWPEFAEHDCAVCHQNLQSSGVRQQQDFGNRQPGVLPWGHSAGLANRALQSLDKASDPQLAILLGKLQQAMNAGRPDRQELAMKARAASAQLKPWVARLDQRLLDRRPLDQLLNSLVANESQIKNPGTDEITQIYLGLAALMASGEFDTSKKERAHLPRSLRVGTPKSYDPDAIRHRLLEFKKIGLPGAP
jgi:hypothetical protein